MTREEELEKEIEGLGNKITELRSKCACSGMPYNEYLSVSDPLTTKLSKLEAEYNSIKAPKMSPLSRFDKKCMMTFYQFKCSCIRETFTSYDGYGYYATDTEVSDIYAVPEDIANNRGRTDFSHVVWHNK